MADGGVQVGVAGLRIRLGPVDQRLGDQHAAEVVVRIRRIL